MYIYGANKTDSPYFGGFNGVSDLQARAKKADDDIARTKEKYGDDIPAGNYDSFTVLEKGETKVELNLSSQYGNTYNYKVNRTDLNIDAPETKMNATGLTDREIFELFTGRAVTESSATEITANTDVYGTSLMFNSDGSFRESYLENNMAGLKSCFFTFELCRGEKNAMYPSDEKIAGFFGGVGKRIDEAYGEGKFTEEQYRKLGEMLDSITEAAVSRTEYRRAEAAYGKWRGSLSPNEAKDVILHEQSLTPEQFQAERKAKIEELIENSFKIDRNRLNEMIRQVRYGILNLFKTK